MLRRKRLPAKTDAQLRIMRRAGLLVGRTLAMLEDEIRAGMSTGELDARAERFIRDGGGRPSFQEVPGYRHTLCVSVNDEVVHGIPGERVLVEGDLVSIDCGAIVDGWHGDAAVTLVVGGAEAARTADLALSAATRRSLWAGIAAFRDGQPLNDVGAAIEDSLAASEAASEAACEAASRGSAGESPAGPYRFGIVDGYEGHGIGEKMHMAPGVPNFRTRPRGPLVSAGATVAIEPMVTLGTEATRELADGWTVVTADGSRAAHWEHTVAATPGGIWVLTALDGGAADLAAIGAPFAPLD